MYIILCKLYNIDMEYKKILLTQGKYAIVGAEDYGYLNQFKWYAYKGNTGIFYAVRKIRNNTKRIMLYMHREIMKTPKGMDIMVSLLH